jgi:hypothetical protein
MEWWLSTSKSDKRKSEHGLFTIHPCSSVAQTEKIARVGLCCPLVQSIILLPGLLFFNDIFLGKLNLARNSRGQFPFLECRQRRVNQNHEDPRRGLVLGHSPVYRSPRYR